MGIMEMDDHVVNTKKTYFLRMGFTTRGNIEAGDFYRLCRTKNDCLPLA